jgi:hypothetical protein
VSRPPLLPHTCAPSNHQSPGSEATGEDDRGDLLLRECWARGTDCIVDVRVTDTDSKLYNAREPRQKSLSRKKRRKNVITSSPALTRTDVTSPLSWCAQWMLEDCLLGTTGSEAKTFAKHLAAKLAANWQRPYSQTCGYVTARLSIAILRATHLCLRGSRVAASSLHTKSAHGVLYDERTVLASHFSMIVKCNDCHGTVDYDWLPAVSGHKTDHIMISL